MTCVNCGGKGQTIRIPGGGADGKDLLRECYRCKGRGSVCSHCGGTGVEPSPHRDRGRMTTNYHCTVCKGSGEEKA